MIYYASAEDFAGLYPNASADAYTRFAWEAQKRIDNARTTRRRFAAACVP